ncbi:MAG: hypothetical protein QOG26_1731, partial [Solirubrobacterales bacterium]|nr:hypothetical protein [Solirubrobacterales bacterium]
KLLLSLALNENKRLGTLTERQREMLAAELEVRGSGRLEQLASAEPVLAA